MEALDVHLLTASYMVPFVYPTSLLLMILHYVHMHKHQLAALPADQDAP